MAHTSLVILGSGYTARHLLPLAPHRYHRVLATSRTPETHLGDVPADQRIRFDLDQPDTWKNIPEQADLLWCFPAVPLDLVQTFSATFDSPTRRIVVLGSTSAYDAGDSQEYPPPWINETAPIDQTKPRVQGEEFLRQHCGAIVLRIAGVYGPNRNPLDWITTGRVGPSRKFVNLIHVDDLATVCLTALQQGKPSEAYNVSDGTPRTWAEICHMAQQRWGTVPPASTTRDETGKRIANTKLTNELRCIIQHPDLYQELDSLRTDTP